jgi:peptidoglycan-associated lipoprotein
MRNYRVITGLFILFISITLAFSIGCAKKGAVAVSEEKPAAAKTEAKAQQQQQTAAEDTAKQKQQLAQAERAKIKEAEAAVSPIAGFDFIYFDYDKYNVKSEFRGTLNKVADWLKKNEGYSLRIEGNCDERGTAEYNLALGEKRANSAKDYMVKLGIDKGKVNTISYGKEKPVDPGHNEEAWAKNRNAHFVVYK